MKVLSLDQSLANTGYVVLDTHVDGLLVVSGTIKTLPKEKTLKRLLLIEETIESLISEHDVDHVFTELVFCPRSGAGDWTSLVKVELIIHRLIAKKSLPLTIIPSAMSRKQSWRTILGITSPEKRASKSWLRDYAYITDQRINEHIADAFCIGIAGLIGLGEYTVEEQVNYLTRS